MKIKKAEVIKNVNHKNSGQSKSV